MKNNNLITNNAIFSVFLIILFLFTDTNHENPPRVLKIEKLLVHV